MFQILILYGKISNEIVVVFILSDVTLVCWNSISYAISNRLISNGDICYKRKFLASGSGSGYKSSKYINHTLATSNNWKLILPQNGNQHFVFKFELSFKNTHWYNVFKFDCTFRNRALNINPPKMLLIYGIRFVWHILKCTDKEYRGLNQSQEFMLIKNITFCIHLSTAWTWQGPAFSKRTWCM